ncbi:hypothetical protein FNV43_RR21756 [Rhamnella rubrinervis]|uniref:Protein kinase domain-containing protein n=1 Tax=Rhamnella rubrinervis TaxID=2594499 RepID=A0A8K0DTT6_9ROSA|nr:hypothetical protein FNV43_RR21756 [Rhamnella rubrinervis]
MYLHSSSRNWQKIEAIGCGSHHGTVIYLALSLYPYRPPKLIAIVHCYGNELSFENHQHQIYNLLLEYAQGGNLLDLIYSNGGCLPEFKVQIYTRMIVKGLRRIHEKGYVHCDLNPTNILVFFSHCGRVQVKIADFGSAKEPGKEEKEAPQKSNKFRFLGTPVYMSPESVVFDEVETPLDIRWLCLKESHFVRWLTLSNEEAELPPNMSAIGKQFLKKCFIRNPRKRWTAKMLLNHPLVVEDPQNLVV